jgi:monoterpene epsilon-lactone hydrolase
MTRRSLASLLAAPFACAARARAQAAPTAYSTSFDSDGTVHITRVIPVPKTISPEAYAFMTAGPSLRPPGSAYTEKMHAVYPTKMEQTIIAGVKVKIFTPENYPAGKRNRVLISLHGGGFTSDSGSIIESVPITALTGTRVIAVDYRLAPEFPFPAAVDDTVAVYKDVLKTYAPKKIGVFGTSAGAVLGAQASVQFRKLGLPLPAVLGFFSGYVDLARYGDSRYIYSANGFKDYAGLDGLGMNAYVASHDRKDPALSPIYADLKGFPPTLCMTGTRDHCLSGTVDFHRALLRADVDARLMVFDAMKHAHWYAFDLPESKEALEAQARFLDQHLG